MCDHHNSAQPSDNGKQIDAKSRQGKALQDGKAHRTHHQTWSRRNFLQLGGLAAGGAMLFGHTPVRALNSSPLLSLLGGSESDRNLVIIRWKGGNDGLNTIIPMSQYNLYQAYRPTIAVPDDNASRFLLGDGNFALNRSMSAVENLWNDGKMAIVHSVGYPQQNYSHFRSSDIWATASDSEEVLNTGWVGRYFDQELPAFDIAPSLAPPGLQIGTETNFLFRTSVTSMALALQNPTQFYRIAQTGQLFDTTTLPDLDCTYGKEALYMRTIANNAFRYSDAIKAAYDASSTQANYPNTELANQLAIVARMIKGRLGSKIYMVSIGGFDTHAEQLAFHPQLLQEVGEAVHAFFDDLSVDQDAVNNTLAMSMSEFGRTVFENGSFGTDHGAGAPVMFWGNQVIGGLKGDFTGIDFSQLDQYGDIQYTTDFRSIYGTVLKEWFCLNPVVVDAILGGNFGLVNNVLPTCTPSLGSNNYVILAGHHPNGNGTTTIKYALLKGGQVLLRILNKAGQPLATLVNEAQSSGSYAVAFNPQEHGLRPGEYIYRLDTGGKTYTRRIGVLF